MKTYTEIADAYARAYHDDLNAFADVKILAEKLRSELCSVLGLPREMVLHAPHDENVVFDPEHSPKCADSVAYSPEAGAWKIGLALKIDVPHRIIPPAWLRLIVLVTLTAESCVLRLLDSLKVAETARKECADTDRRISEFVGSICDAVVEYYSQVPDMRIAGGAKILRGFGPG